MHQFCDSAEPDVFSPYIDDARAAFHILENVGIRIVLCFRSSIAAPSCTPADTTPTVLPRSAYDSGPVFLATISL